jgi:hypothetical protein
MEARPFDSSFRRKPFVEDCRHYGQQGGAQARSTCGAGSKLELFSPERQRRGHHAVHSRAGLELAA